MSKRMRRLPALLGLAVLPALGVAAPAAAQTASLVKDIAGGSRFHFGFDPEELWAFQGKILFSASEESSGRELWISDGSGSGTRLLADFFPGISAADAPRGNSSNPRILGTAGSLAYGLAFHDFVCCGPPARAHLWRSDATREGTFLLPDSLFRVWIPYSEQLGRPLEPPIVPVVLRADGTYFIGCTGFEDCALWRTDGSLDGTRLVKPLGGTPAEVTLAGGRLFFTTLRQLWVSDGTAAGTAVVREFPFAAPHLFAALGNRVLFLAPAAAPGTGEELWVSDGTAGGTRALTGFEVERPFAQTNFLKALGDRVYFVADDATHGAELWGSDGTPTGTVRLTDFGFHDPFRGPDGDFNDGLLAASIGKVGDRVVFWATDGLHPFAPWSTRGTPQSTSPLCTGCNFQDTSVDFVPLGGRLLFRADDGGHGAELWVTDGAAPGTRLLKDVCPSSCSGVESELARLPGAVAFQGPGTGAGFNPKALWTSDGTPQGTRRLADVGPTSFGRPLPIGAVAGKIFFGALANDHDPTGAAPELWASDGTAGGTRQVSDNGRTGLSAEVAQLVAAGDHVVFTASEDGNARHVWRSTAAADDALKSPDPTFSDSGESSRLATAGGKVFLILASYPIGNQLLRVGDDGQTVPLTHLDESLHIFFPVDFQGRLYFVVARDLSFGTSELWQSDGTPVGTHRALDRPDLGGFRYLRALGSELWFVAHDPTVGLAIWRTDGTQAVALPAGDPASFLFARDPEFTRLGSAVYFVALRFDADGGRDEQLFRTDGTVQGTSPLTDFPGLDGVAAQPAELTVLGGNLYFFATEPAMKRALWRSDGTPGGTARILGFHAAFHSDSQLPHYGLTTLGSRLAFVADDGVHGFEPWISDGTAAGTALLRDVRPGSASSEVTSFTAAGGQLYFAADDGAHGFELWRTDGTPVGTRLVQDLAPEGASSYPAGLTATSNRLYFSADDGLSGGELWALPLSGAPCTPSPVRLCLNGGRFQVEASWRTAAGDSGAGHAAALSADTGYFWFFGPGNVEAVLKVLDGRGLNGHFWAFYGALSNVEYTLTVTDTQTGLSRRYTNPQGQLASVGDTQAFGPQGAHARKTGAEAGVPPRVTERRDATAATGTCIPAAGRLCLNGGRFAVEATWKDFAGHTGAGTAAGITGDTGYLWFFDPANVEVVVKVLDGTPVNGHFWVFYGALSNVEYTLTVTDTMTGTVRTYKNALGSFGSVADAAAF